jgi:hypothetical protein
LTIWRAHCPPTVIAGLDPAIHEAAPPERQYGFACCSSSWMRGSSPRMTNGAAI